MNSSQKEDIVWYCCACGYGGMSIKLHQGCIASECGHKKCSYCKEEYVWERRPTLYPRRIANEALRVPSNRRGLEAPREVSISRAASLIGSGTTEDSNPSLSHLPTKDHTLTTVPEPEPTSQINSDHTDIDLIGLICPEISGSIEAYGDNEGTPRSSCEQDTIDPFDLTSDTDNGTHLTKYILGPECHEDPLVLQFNPISDPYSLHNSERDSDVLQSDGNPTEEHLIPDAGYDLGIEEALNLDEFDFFENSTPSEFYNYTYSLEPHTSASGLPTNINTTHDPGIYESLQHSTSWPNPSSDATYELLPQSFPYNVPFYSSTTQLLTTQLLGTPYRPPDPMDLSTDGNEEVPQSALVPRHLNSENCWRTGNKRTTSQEDGELKHGDRIIRACEPCRLKIKRDENVSLACPFYKHNPGYHRNCMPKKFNSISALGQHLDKEHAARQPTDGIEKLATISKSRGGPNTKWFWIWRKLFGEQAAQPKCPYPHPIQDMTNYILTQSLKDFHTREAKLDVSEIEEVVSQWIASNLEPLNDGR
ncbi:hypothetical protein F5Y04DRAFT_288801 [Hypomontagnella monticulosa]|nr:hypothetical protein F5Y04DRAFT_288801 [Hypomontagnella monticulosa]